MPLVPLTSTVVGESYPNVVYNRRRVSPLYRPFRIAETTNPESHFGDTTLQQPGSRPNSHGLDLKLLCSKSDNHADNSAGHHDLDVVMAAQTGVGDGRHYKRQQ
jgi:hypothetical protein